MNVSAGADATENTLLLGQSTGHGKGLIVCDLNALDDLGFSGGIFQVEVVGKKSGAGALDFMRAGLESLAGESLGDDRRILRFDSDGLERGLAGLEGFHAACDRAAGPDRRDDNVHFSIRIAPDFLRRGFDVNGGVCGVVELLGHPGIWGLLNECFRLRDRAAHPLGTRRENELRPQHGEECPALEAHRLGHGEDHFVSLGGRHEGQCDAGVSAGGLDDDRAGLENATLLSVLDHGHADAVFHATERIEKFTLERNRGGKPGGDAVELDERCAADCFDDVIVDVAHWSWIEPKLYTGGSGR